MEGTELQRLLAHALCEIGVSPKAADSFAKDKTDLLLQKESLQFWLVRFFGERGRENCKTYQFRPTRTTPLALLLRLVDVEKEVAESATEEDAEEGDVSWRLERWVRGRIDLDAGELRWNAAAQTFLRGSPATPAVWKGENCTACRSQRRDGTNANQ